MIVFETYLSKERHISAVVIIQINTVHAAITHPEQRGISQVYGVQHDASDGKDCSSNVHKHSEAHLRVKIPSIKS